MIRFVVLIIIFGGCRSLIDKSLSTPIDLHDITFFKNQGWIISYGSGVVLHSNNNGRTWHRIAQVDSLYFEKIQFTNEKTGWAAGEKGTLLKTNDGGKHWTRNEVDPLRSEGLLFYSMLWRDELHGILGAQFRAGQQRENLVYYTDDGGKHWFAKNAPDLFFTIVIDNNARWWATGTDQLFTSVNGREWNITYSDSLKRLGQLRGFCFNHENELMAIGFKGTLLRNSLDGNGWRTDHISENRMRQVVKLNDKTILVAGDKTNNDQNVLISKDNGTKWDPINVPSDVHRIIIKGSSAWMIGKKGLLIKLDNP